MGSNLRITRRGLLAVFKDPLPAIFVIFNVFNLPWFLTAPVGCDAVTYLRGAAAYVAGRDPWQAVLYIDGSPYHFAGLPPTVLAFVPFAPLPEWLVATIWVLLSAASALVIVRRLRLPLYYLAFPPLVVSAYAGNPQLPLLALILIGWGALAPVLKVFAVVPLVGERRWRALLLGGGLFAGSVLVAPSLWTTYLGEWATIAARQTQDAHGGLSAWGLGLPILLVTIGALAVLAALDLRAAGWIAVPAVWPGSQLQYATMALPVIDPLVAALLTIPLPGPPALVALIYAWRAVRRRRASGLRLTTSSVASG